MKKPVKITLVTLGSLVGLVLLTIAVALWMVFTPARLTPIVASRLPKFVTCEASVERVELTFFSSFPRLGLRIDGVSLVNPVQGAPCDTLLKLGQLDAAIDVKAFLGRDELILRDIILSDGAVCLFTDSLGRTNYDIVRPMPEEPEPQPEDGGLTLSRIDLDELTLENIDIVYVDMAQRINAHLPGLSLALAAEMNGDDISADLRVLRFDAAVTMGQADSMLAAMVENVAFTVKGSLRGDVAEVEDFQLDGTVSILAYGGEKYLSETPIFLKATADADLASQKADIHNAMLSLAGLGLTLDGSVQNDTLRGIDTDLHYKLADWPLEKLLALVPPAFESYVEGITASGLLSSEGTVKGLYAEGSMPNAEGSMPMIDANVSLSDGRASYPAMLPYPLMGLAADLDIHTDLSDAASVATINSLAARTPHSSLAARGTVNALFSDPHAVLAADLDADLIDAKPFIPESLNLTAAGRVAGRVNVDARMSQLTSMRLDRMRLSGSLLASNLDAVYDTISVQTPSAKLDFTLPNANPTTRTTTFAAVTLASDKLTAQMGTGTRAVLDGTRLALETSNVLDTENVPAVKCDFSFTNLAARMDDMSVSVARPSGTVSMEPGRRNAATQRLKVVYNGGAIEGSAGDVAAVLDKLDIDATVIYDSTKENVWSRFIPRGSIAASGMKATVPSLNYPVEIPVLSTDFTPRRFTIREARVRLDESDFSLDGTVDNIIPYFRGDSILRADFNFNSPVTNISQLMALTSGIGTEEETEAEPENTPADEFSGPYMVPQGIDVSLHTDIREVLWEGEPLFSNIRGDIQVKDGALLITPEVSFDSPITQGNIQLMYRTPEKNDLFAGVGIHLNRIDMQELVGMIPDLDQLMPMLRGFSGTGDFHAVAEGHLDSTYRFKMSTLRGSGSISAVDLTLKDDELFQKIKVLLKYKEEGAIRVDSLRAEFTVYRDQIDVYPFLLKVDRYGAVISGQHNLDMNFNYNISLVESPLPFRVAVDVTGNASDLKFKVFSKSRYPDFYRPAYNGVVESREMELRNIIRNSLLQGQE